MISRPALLQVLPSVYSVHTEACLQEAFGFCRITLPVYFWTRNCESVIFPHVKSKNLKNDHKPHDLACKTLTYIFYMNPMNQKKEKTQTTV